MFGNGGNSFGALAMDDDQPSAGPSTQVIEGEELDVDWIQLVRTNHDVDVRVSEKVELEGLPAESNLMVVSNLWDLLIAGGNSDIRIHRLSQFHKVLEGAAKDASPTSDAIQTISLHARPVWIRLAMNEERLVVATAEGSGVHIFKLKEVLSGNTSPYHSFTTDIPSSLLDVLPNPATSLSDQHSRLVILLASEGLVIADIEDCRLSAPLSGPFTCASWSAKGKQIAVGTPSGKLVQYTPEGTAKAEIPSPPDLESYYPVFVQWLENDLFLVSYAQTGAQPDDQAETYIIHRNKSEFTFTKFFDPLNSMGLASRASLYRHFSGLKTWGEKTKHLALIVSGASSEIGVLHGHAASEKESPKWEVLLLEETSRGVLPAAKAGVRDDASVLALALDLTSTQVIRRGIVGGIELPDLPPQPRLLAYTQEGTVIPFDIRYPDAGLYPGMIAPSDITSSPSSSNSSSTQPPPSNQVPAATSVSSPAPPPSTGSTFGSTGFGQTSNSSASAFGSSAFGQSSTSAFGSASRPAAFGASAFGQASTSSPSGTSTAGSTFGSSSKPGAFSGFGQASTPSGFGQSAFGQSSKSAAFGSSTTPTAFGPSTTPTSTPAKPAAFGSTSTPVPAFGSSSTPTSKPSAFGSSAFGSTSTPGSAFGQSAFGQSSKPSASSPSAFGSSAFGSTTTSSSSNVGFGAFGSASKPSGTSFGFGGSAFGQAAKADETKDKPASPFGSGGSAFGSTSFGTGGGSAFGASSAFGQSAFGSKQAPSPSSEAPKPTFAGFGPQASAQDKPASSTSAFSGFGPKADGANKPGSAFGGFGQQSTSSHATEPTQSAFAGFGSTSSQTSAFGGFGQKKASSPAPEISNNPETDDFGLGGFASALDKTTDPAGVPGLADSPPGSPVLGTDKKPAGLDDETPPHSPPPKIVAPKAAATAPSSSSAFIKPATAFGGAPSVGSFGQTSKSSTPAFGSGSTPAAFATLPSSSPSAFGSSAFGKPSTIGSSAFGSSGFGQSSVPAGFGKSSVPASTKPIGNISGGFGAFGAKSDGQPKSTGFGGFASNGTSVFGSDADKEKKPNAFAGLGGSRTSIFGSATDKKEETASATPEKQVTTSAFSFGIKPATTTPQKEATINPAPPTPAEQEEVQGYDVPVSSEESKQESTTPAATPVRKPAADQSTTPDSTPSKPTEPPSSSTPVDEPAEPVKPPAPEEDEEQIYHVEAGAAFLDDGHATDEEYQDEYEGEGDNEDYEDYEDYEEYDEEEYEEEEEDEEETPLGPGRRRSSSIPPDMSPIKEEVSDELASEEDEGEAEEEEYEEEASKVESEVLTTRSLTKSPPTWFAKPFKTEKSETTDNEPISPTPGSEGASLFARLSPAPSTSPKEEKKEPVLPSTTPAQPKLSAFSFKHASKTSSPLAGPPENAGTTPESSPAKPPAASGLFGSRPTEQSSKPEDKPAPSAFSLFGTKPAGENKDLSAAPPAFSGFGAFGSKPAETETEAAKPASNGGFSLFGAQPKDQKEEQAKAFSPAPNGTFNFFGPKDSEVPKAASPAPASPAPAAASGGFSLFGNKPTDSVKAETPPSIFGAAKTIPAIPAETSKPAFGLGLGKPGAPATPFASPAVTIDNNQPLFGKPVPAASPPPPDAPTAPAKFALPSRETVAPPSTRPDDGSKSMGAIVEKIILALGDDMDNLKAVLDANAKYHGSFNATGLPPVTADNLSSHDIVALSSISQLSNIVEDLRNELADLRNEDNGTELKLAELQSRMLKTDMKTGQADKFLKARQDPSFAKVMQIKDLSPEQAASQTRLRKAVQVAETKIEELEASIAGLKRRAELREQGRSNTQQPALERVQRSVRNIDAAIRDRQQTIDDLARRIGGVRLSSPSRSGSPAPSSLRNTPRKSTIVHSSATARSISLEPTKEILKEVDSALNGDRNSRLLVRLEKIKSAKLTKLENKTNGNKKPILIDALPLPGQLPPSFLNRIKSPSQPTTTKVEPASTQIPDSHALPSTPSVSATINESTATSSPSSTFGGIKFNLDPGNISDLAKSTGGISTHRGSGGGSTRSHTSAAKYVPHQSPGNGTAASPVGGSGIFDFKGKGMNGEEKDKEKEGKSKPSGFFSFSGFGAK